MREARCYLCKVAVGYKREQACYIQCVQHEENQEEAARLRDVKPFKTDGVDYRDTDHPRFDRIEVKRRKDWKASPGWADIVSGKCKCTQCEYARFKDSVKRMVDRERQRLSNS